MAQTPRRELAPSWNRLQALVEALRGIAGAADLDRLQEQLLTAALELAEQAGPVIEATQRYAELERENVELRERDEALRRREQLQRRAIAQAGAVPYAFDYARNEYTFMGEQILELTGYSVAELTPDLFGSLVEESVLLGEQAHLDSGEASRRTRAGEFEHWRCDLRIRTRDGETRWVADSSVEILGEDGSSIGSIGMLQDITERRQTAEERTRLAAVLEATTDVVGMADTELRALYLNRAGRRLLGIGEDEEVSSASLADFHPRWAAARVRHEGVPTATREGAWTAENALLSRDGREIPVSQVLIAHKDSDGTVQYYSTVARDISERRELEAQLRQAQKMEAVGRLAGGIAHDFNNLLTAIGGYSMLLLDRLGQDDPLRADVEEITKAGDLAAALTQQLLVFSRRQVLKPRVLDLNAVVRDVEALVRRLVREDITLETRLAPEPVRVSADPGQLSQVIVNLVVNGEDAMPDGGRMTIETFVVDAGERLRAGVATGAPYAVLAVSDTGVGMTEETRSQIFEPFFTTKQGGKGTGLGLATVFGIVEGSGGHIFVSSRPGEGTRFEIYLPRVDTVPVETRAQSRGADSPGGDESILLVEDDDAVRALARDVLLLHGYSVVEAVDGADALRIASDWEGPLDLLVTDLVMPGMSGRELAQRLGGRWPDLSVLFMSGYTDDAIFRTGALESRQAFLQKPFTPALLAQKTREILTVAGDRQS